MTRELSRRAILQSVLAPLAPSRRKPNLIVILADDLGYGDLSCYGSQYNRTPNIDALAKGGVRFTDFHSNGAVCSPTRAALTTGRYQQRCGITAVITAAGSRDQGLAPGQLTFARVLKNAGYRTAIFGKWHLGYRPEFNPDKHGFDEFRGYVSGNVDYFSHVDQAGYADWWHNSKLEPKEGYTTELVTRHGVRFIEENRDRPFCLYLPFETVHAPYQGPNDKPSRIAGQVRPERNSGDVRPTYRDMIASMDDGIGRVVSTIKRCGLERDSFIFFFSDNGATKVGSNGICRGWKGQLWEGGHREPAIAYWPGRISPGGTSAELTIGMDLFPTLLEIAGVDWPRDRKLDGVSFFRHLSSGETLGERQLFWGHGEQRAVRRGHWKLTLMPGEDPFLADLKADPGEKTNLAGAQPALVSQLRDALARWEKDVTQG